MSTESFQERLDLTCKRFAHSVIIDDKSSPQDISDAERYLAGPAAAPSYAEMIQRLGGHDMARAWMILGWRSRGERVTDGARIILREPWTPKCPVCEGGDGADALAAVVVRHAPDAPPLVDDDDSPDIAAPSAQTAATTARPEWLDRVIWDPRLYQV